MKWYIVLLDETHPVWFQKDIVTKKMFFFFFSKSQKVNSKSFLSLYDVNILSIL